MIEKKNARILDIGLAFMVIGLLHNHILNVKRIMLIIFLCISSATDCNLLPITTQLSQPWKILRTKWIASAHSVWHTEYAQQVIAFLPS